MAAFASRKSFLRAEMEESVASTPSSSLSPSRRRRSIAAPRVAESMFEENDDEAERQARRERNEFGSPISSATTLTSSDRRQSFGLSSVAGLTATEVTSQIAQCLKLGAENKINDKNAFQLKMIDFLVYTLKKQDPNMSNLQMASASLDVSAKIYGFRVDKVHSDLLKIAAGIIKEGQRALQNQENNENEDANQPLDENGERQPKKKKRRNRANILSSAESLKGKLETYDPYSLIRCQRDTQTSDMLFQAALPQHANQGIALNLFNDILLDHVPEQDPNSIKNYEFFCVDDFGDCVLCPAYSAFKFLDWSPDDEPEEPSSQNEEHDGEFRFDLDAAVPDDNIADDPDIMMDCGDAFEERCDRQAQNRQVERIVDFHDIIANNPNPDVTYEYSYIQKNLKIQWAGPSFWKVTVNRHTQGSRIVETCGQTRKKKEINYNYVEIGKDIFLDKFSQASKQTKLVTKTTRLTWSDEKVTRPQVIQYDLKNMYSFFNKPKEFLRYSQSGEDEINTTHVEEPDEANYDYNNDNDTLNYCGPDNLDGDTVGDQIPFDIATQPQDGGFTQNTQGFSFDTQTQGAFVGDNLVSAPALISKVFIPYSQRAKKIDMRQLKRAMWKQLKTRLTETEKENVDSTFATEDTENIAKEIESKHFSELYRTVPSSLSKLNAESLSPSIAFITLLHLANEKSLRMDNVTDLSDVTIRSAKDPSD